MTERLQIVGVEPERVVTAVGHDVVDIGGWRTALHAQRVLGEVSSTQPAPVRTVAALGCSSSSRIPLALVLGAA